MKSFRALLLGIALACCALPGMAATTFYWNAGATTFDSTDFSAGDTTATSNGGVSLSGTAAKVGANGLLTTNGQDYYKFDSTSLCNLNTGTAGGWFQQKTALPANGSQVLFRCMDTVGSSSIDVTIGSTDEARISISNNGGSTISLVTTACNMAVDNWYFIKIAWDIPNDDRKVSCYDSSMSLIQTVSDTSTDLGTNAPSAFTDLRWGNPGSGVNATWSDNFFLTDSYDDPIETFGNITTFIPTYSTGPTNGTFTTTTLPFTYTVDQDGTDYVAACTDGQTIATGANVVSGTCSGGAALCTGSDAAVAGVSNTVTATSCPSGTNMDVYLVHKSGLGGYSTVQSMPNRSTTSSGPSFDVGIVCDDVDTNSLACTYDADGTANRIFLCAKPKGATAPADGAAVEAGTGCSGTATENTTGSADSLQIDFSGDPLAEQDIWGVLEQGTSNYSSLSTVTAIRFSEPTGYVYLNKTGSPGGGEYGLFDSASPAIANGDTMQVATTSDSFALGIAAHTVTPFADTTFQIATGGDLSRQLIYRRFSDYSVPGQSDASPVPLSVNDIGPAYIGPVTYIFQKSATLSWVLDADWMDMEGDAMTHSIANNPAGGSLTGSETITGAYTTCGRYTNPQLTSTDEYGKATVQNIVIEVGEIVPDVVGATEASAISSIEALCSFNAVLGDSKYSTTVAAGHIIETDPAAGELVDYDEAIFYTLSLGACTVPDVSGMTLAEARAAIAAACP